MLQRDIQIEIKINRTQHLNPRPLRSRVSAMLNQINRSVYNVKDITSVSVEETKGCFKCRSLDHFICNCPEMKEREKKQEVKASSAPLRGIPKKNPGSGASSRGVERDTVVRSEGRALARTYAIRAREEAEAPDVITGTFSIHDISVITSINLGSTHSYICMELIPRISMLIESTELVVKVSNPLGRYVLVDQVCRNCPLTIRGHYFSAKLMLLSFNEFNVILGMDWLTPNSVVVNCGRKVIELKCEYGNVLQVGPDESNKLPVIVSPLTAKKY
ncbi:uncharacterized protein [Gossypium hirsutum]|uniref:Gag-Pol polyprotein n=1 Tax=Gossypium hirsutum TaxID=3635 RepID=A0ABM3C0R8_GOSHI|nr:uncharacterized protein LOC121231919 [Gossypium hirsutum]